MATAGTAWWGARRALPSVAWPSAVRFTQLSPTICGKNLGCRVQCCADVHAMQLVEKEYAELELKTIQHQVGGVRVRQHVNPFKASLMVPTIPPAWETEFEDPTLPLHVDIGCVIVLAYTPQLMPVVCLYGIIFGWFYAHGDHKQHHITWRVLAIPYLFPAADMLAGSGRLLMVLAKRSLGSSNFLGIDIRDKLLERSTIWAEELNLTNIHFMVANATIALDAIMSTYPGHLRLVSILCPDPHFKQRHRKRRIVQKVLVDTLIKCLPSGGQVFLQSDIEEVARDMRDQFDEHTAFTRLHKLDLVHCDSDGWLLQSPLGVSTEREIHAVANGGSIYRSLFERI